MRIEHFGPVRSIEAFDISVLVWLPGLYVIGFDLVLAAPVGKSLGECFNAGRGFEFLINIFQNKPLTIYP